jgi:transcriptional regulator with XRE-family HTH domain
MKVATGQVIKAFRLHLNYKHEYIGAKINITTHTLSNIEHGRVGLDLEKLYKISKVFGVSSKDILLLIIEVFESPESLSYLNGAIKHLISPFNHKNLQAEIANQRKN